MVMVEITVQRTPNPNAMKFIVNRSVKSEGKASFKKGEGDHLALVRDLLALASVEQVHLFEDVITVSQDGTASWEDLFPQVESVIQTRLPAHDSDAAQTPGEKQKLRTEHQNPDLQKIDEILDRTVRPGLQGDGGDIELLDYKDKILTVLFQGACGGCPSSTMGTLYAIQGILQEEFDPQIEVRPAQ